MERSGDVRVALEDHRLADRQRERVRAEQVTDAVIADAVSKAKTEVRQRSVESLTDDQRVVYEFVTEHKPVAAPDL